jgi:hypothetical protein
VLISFDRTGKNQQKKDQEVMENPPIFSGHAVAQWLRHCAKIRKVAGSILDGVIGIFHRYNPFGCTNNTGVDSASNRNEYQEYFLGSKGGWCVGLTALPLFVLIALKSGSLSLLESSGSVQGLLYLCLLSRLILHCAYCYVNDKFYIYSGGSLEY